MLNLLIIVLSSAIMIVAVVSALQVRRSILQSRTAYARSMGAVTQRLNYVADMRRGRVGECASGSDSSTVFRADSRGDGM